MIYKRTAAQIARKHGLSDIEALIIRIDEIQTEFNNFITNIENTRIANTIEQANQNIPHHSPVFFSNYRLIL